MGDGVATVQDNLRVESVKSAIEWSKQILTLATATIVISGTFIRDILKGTIICLPLLITCWVAMLISILFGLLFLGALSFMLREADINKIDIYSAPAGALGIAHIVFFFVGVAVFVYFIVTNLK